MKEENKNNEEIEEDLEKEIEEESEEKELEEIVEEEYFEEDNFRLKNFLMNQDKEVSLNQIAESPIVSLESVLPKQKFKEEEEKRIEYNLFKDSEGEKYISNSGIQMDNPHWSEEEKEIEKQKRLYEDPMALRGDKGKGSHEIEKYIRPEDTLKKDYLMKKRFGE